MNNNRLHTVLTALVLMALVACKADGDNPGWTFVPDMQYSQAYETFSSVSPLDDEIKDSMSARMPVAGTIPRGMVPADEAIRTNEAYMASYMSKYHFTNKKENYQAEYDAAGELLQNPIAKSDEVLKEGKRLYTVYCQVCHGKEGAGDGQIVTLPNGNDGPYTAIPPAYSDRLPTLKDGQVFYSVSFGKGQMGGYASQMSVDERWAVIHYIQDKFSGEATAEAN